jgi:hypothetical protein
VDEADLILYGDGAELGGGGVVDWPGRKGGGSVRRLGGGGNGPPKFGLDCGCGAAGSVVLRCGRVGFGPSGSTSVAF